MAILTTGPFDASTVDPASVLFAGASPGRWALFDVDGDGDLDLILHFPTSQVNIQPGDTEACLEGMTTGGQPIFGCDSVRVVPPGTDSDADSRQVLPPPFDDSNESSLGTDQFDSCPNSSDHNAWPPDLNNDDVVDVGDVLQYRDRILASLGDAAYLPRLDLIFDGRITMGDVLSLGQYFFQTCVP